MTSRKSMMTRAQARAWLYPMRSCLRRIKDTGEAEEIEGYAVTRLPGGEDYARIDWCIAGFLGLMDRLCPQIDTGPLHRIEMRLAADKPLTVDVIDAAMRTMCSVEDALLRKSVTEVRDAVMVERISIELNAVREAA